MYELTEEYLTGIGLIDDEHRQLFAIAEKAYQLLQEEFLSDKYDQIAEVLRELFDYTEYHFADEERYMESIGYGALFIQKAQHKFFIDKMEEFIESDFEDGQDEKIIEILTFLTDWLFNHILKMDKLIGTEG